MFTWGALPVIAQDDSKSKPIIPRTRQESFNIQDNDVIGDDVSVSSKQSKEDASSSNVFQLTSINLTIKKGEFIGLMGSVGSGKSTLLSSIVAECDKLDGDVAFSDVETGCAFVAQQPWLQRGTIRDNILFGKAYDEVRYKQVLRACALEDDLFLLPSGDLTGIGDSGSTLSGGQKARIALARAVYQDKTIYIMDDILSAVDVQVAKHIFQHCILGLLGNKTKLLCTHHLQYFLHVDHLIILENGRISKQGNIHLRVKFVIFRAFLKTFHSFIIGFFFCCV